MKTIARCMAVLCLALIFACGGGGLTDENYDAIKNEMTVEEVKDILGEPTESPTVGVGGLSGGAYIWKDGDKSITVTVLNDKVKGKAKAGF